MKIVFSFVTITLMSIRGFLFANIDTTIKCDRFAQPNTIDVVGRADNDDDTVEITSTVDYLEFNNKQISKVSVPMSDKEPVVNVDNDGNVYFEEDGKLFVRKSDGSENVTKVEGIAMQANRTNVILIDKLFDNVYIGTHNGLFMLSPDNMRAIQFSVTDNIAVDFGVIDSFGNIYFGTDGSNTDRSEQLYILNRTTNSLFRINGIETSLGSYPIESRVNRNKIAIDSKNNVYVGAYSTYLYCIRSGEKFATKIKDNRDSGSVTGIVVDSRDNVYGRTYSELFVFRNGLFVKILETIDYFDLFISIDDDDNVHFNIDGEEHVLKAKDIRVVQVSELPADGYINLNRNLMVRNNILYFTTRSRDNATETICAIKPGETNVTKIYTMGENYEYYSMAVDRHHNIYFTAKSAKISNQIVAYVLRSNAKMAIEIRGITSRVVSSAYADQKNNVYFSASNGLHVLNFDEVIPHRLRATASNISSVVIAQNDDIYFATYYDGAFVLKSGETEARKIGGISEEYGPMAVVATADKYYDIVYFERNDNDLYKLKSGDTVVNRVIEKSTFQFYLSDCRNNTYYLIGNEIFIIESGESVSRRIAEAFGQILSIDIDTTNQLYLATTIGLQVLSPGDAFTSLLTDVMLVRSLAIDKDDNVYFGTDFGASMFKSGVVQAINGISEPVVRIVVNDNDIYFVTEMGRRLFLLQNKLELGKLFKNRTLGEIDNNNDATILNALNFLNIGNDYLLSHSKSKVVNKTETSAIVVGIKGKFIGQFDVQYAIRNRDDIKYFLDLNFLRKAIFFNYINENLFHYKKTNDIKEIEVYLGNLRFGAVRVSKDSNLNSSFEFQNVCDNKKVANPSTVNQIYKFSECNYNGKETIKFEITSGINRPKNVDLQKSTGITLDDEMRLSSYLYNNSEPMILSHPFQLSNANSFSKETILYNFSEPEQDIVIPPKQQISVKYSVRTLTNKISLKLRQKIQGVTVCKVTDTSGEQVVQITLRNAMEVLLKYSQLPTEVTINRDNSITFHGRAILISERESTPMVIRNFV